RWSSPTAVQHLLSTPGPKHAPPSSSTPHSLSNVALLDERLHISGIVLAHPTDLVRTRTDAFGIPHVQRAGGNPQESRRLTVRPQLINGLHRILLTRGWGKIRLCGCPRMQATPMLCQQL